MITQLPALNPPLITAIMSSVRVVDSPVWSFLRLQFGLLVYFITLYFISIMAGHRAETPLCMMPCSSTATPVSGRESEERLARSPL